MLCSFHCMFERRCKLRKAGPKWLCDAHNQTLDDEVIVPVYGRISPKSSQGLHLERAM